MTQTYNYYYSSFLLLCILIVVILLESCLPAKQEECMRKVNFNECDDERKTFFWQNFWLGKWRETQNCCLRFHWPGPCCLPQFLNIYGHPCPDFYLSWWSLAPSQSSTNEFLRFPSDSGSKIILTFPFFCFSL